VKTCSYCGQENADEAPICIGCGTTEFRPTASPEHPRETEPTVAGVPPETGATRWNSRQAWKCALTLILLETLVLFSIRAATRNSGAFASWWGHSALALATSMAIQGGMFLIVTLLFSRSKSVDEFLSRTGLRLRPTLSGWLFCWLAIGIAFLDLYGKARGWTASGRLATDYYRDRAAVYFSLLGSSVIVPIYEEAVTRGFLYRAFRGSYAAPFSIVLIICFSTIFHWAAMSLSLFTAGCLISLWIMLCFVREKTESLWNCILCHAAYNSVVRGQWQLCLLGALLMGIGVRRSRKPSPPAP
jgi:membrane protease YdiL (CAAX protease family)